MLIPVLATMGGVDWLVLGVYLAVLAGSGWWLSRREQRDTRDYFLGGRSVPVWAAAVSLMATALSVATFTGVPEASYVGDLTYLIFGLSQLIGVIVVAVLFIPAFYRLDVATVYGLLDRRFGPAARRAGSWMFMIGRVLASGARLFIAALAGSMVLFDDIAAGHIAIAIGVLVVTGVFYTLMGGIRAVIWSDVIQAVVFVTAAVAALVIIASRVPAEWADVFATLETGGDGGASKLRVVDWGVSGFSLTDTWTVVTALTGWVLLSIGSFGTDQDLTQRMLTCRTPAAGARSAVGGIVLSIPVTALFLVVGLGLWVYYARWQQLGLEAPAVSPDGRTEKVFLTFILNEMPAGMSGLMMAGLFAAGLSSLNSALNAMASTFVNDYYREARPDRGEEHYVRVGRRATMMWGVVLGGFALASIWIQRSTGDTLIDYALNVMAPAYAGLVAVFMTALLTGRGSERSAVAALAVGFLTVALLWVQPWKWLGMDAWPLAAPWRLVIATAAAFAVCLAGSARTIVQGAADAPGAKP